jgi:hypothetical protein
MFDAKGISQAIGAPAFQAINASNLPKIVTMTLLQVWTQSSRAKLRELAESEDLLPVLEKQYRPGLEEANEARLNSPHLTPVECLQAAGLPLQL